MKKRNLLISLIAAFTLSGCELLDSFFGVEKTPQQKEEEKEESKPSGNNEEQQIPGGGEDQQTPGGGEEQQNPPEENKKIGEFYGGVVENENYVGYEFSKSDKEIIKPTTGIGDINIYAFNDFHGSVLENEDEAGLKKIGSFYRVKSQEANTLIFDQGDTWQGSFESNYQYGAIVQDVFNYSGVSLRTVGNHDFDWGLSHLEDVINRKSGDDYIPCLASNVYDYANGINGTVQQSKYGKEYATFVLDNGIKVGVVGVIGKSQITSICSQLVDTICFTDHISKVKEISDYLRTEKECDVVIASCHESTADMIDNGLAEISPVSHKRYTDLVLLGHAHYKQDKTENNVKFVQWASNGKTTGSIQLKYNFETNQLVDEETTVSTYYPNNYTYSDSTINSMIDDYLAITEPVASQVISTNFNGSFDDTSLAYLMAEAIFDSVKSMEKTIDFAVTNYARDGFNGSTMTYGDLYKCFPFDNQIILMDVSTTWAQNNIGWNQSYREDTTKVPINGTPCRIAVIDYLGLHQDENREIDKFKNATNVEVFKDSNNQPLIYREILKDYLLKNSSKTFNASDYTSENPHFRVD